LFKASSFMSLFLIWFFVPMEFRWLTLKCRYWQYTYLEQCVYLCAFYPPMLPTASCGYTCRCNPRFYVFYAHVFVLSYVNYL
jgi:hypothetical protein